MKKLIGIFMLLSIFLFITLLPTNLSASTLGEDAKSLGDINPPGQFDKVYNDKLSLMKGNFSSQPIQKQQMEQKEKEKRGLENLNKSEKSRKYLVKFKDSTPVEEINQLLSEYKYKVIGNKDNRIFRLTIDNVDNFKQLKGEMVEWIETDEERKVNILPNDPYLSSQWAVNALSLPKAWDITTGSNNVTVAVIDSGINRYHPDFQYTRIANGWDLIFDEPVDWDSRGHGTSVTGVIAASTNNSLGISGVNWNVTIVPFRVVYSSGAIYTSDVVQAIYYAADVGCKIINLSLGGSTYSNSENSAIQYAISKGSIVVASAGNDGNSTLKYPASYPNVVSVASINRYNNRSSFSNFNSYVDVSAPGESILTTSKDYYYNPYVFVDGTSFSAPYVSGIAALVAAKVPNITPEKFYNALTATSTDLGSPGRDNYYGYGLVNAEKLLTYFIKPSTPVGFYISSLGDRRAVLNWMPNSESNLVGYQLEYKTATSTAWSIISVGKTITSYSIANLVNGTPYQFRIKAKDTAGNWSDYSEVVSGSPIDNVAPPIPTGFKVTRVNDKQVTLGWTAVTATDLAGYLLEYRGGNEPDWTEVSIGKVTTYTLTGLANEQTYLFRLKARDTSNNMSAASNEVSGVPVDKVPPAVPTGFKVGAIGRDKEITLIWNANKEVDLGGYELAYQRSGTTTWSSKPVEAGETTVTIDGLVHNVAYTLKLRAKDEKGNWSNYTPTVSATAKDLMAPAQPTGLTLQPSDRSISVTWEANQETDLGGYQLEYKTFGSKHMDYCQCGQNN
ncbi:S8 family serine peptidase [Ammoniphilus sp. YIM 78166]|uniref:S8 family serine peptidase n=1 Tax=Ammoniphilus sp. YIM 78166 TaxID=1644106 RepID=UPI00106FEF3E|nr:S8 family serine peptidase [Ammoniphilus sp. YIM 78166]